jgi:hypothetical protein
VDVDLVTELGFMFGYSCNGCLLEIRDDGNTYLLELGTVFD